MSDLYVRFGERLQKTRIERKLELADVAAELRMNVESIAAIEAGNPNELPGPLFLPMFARSYAGFLGIDYNKEIEELRDELGEPAPPSTTGIQRTISAERPEMPVAAPAGGGLRIVLTTVIAIAVLAGLVFVGMKLLQQNQTGSSSENRPGRQSTDDVVFDDETLATPKSYESAFLTDSISGLTMSMMARVPSSILLISDGDTVMYGEMKIGQDYQFEARQRAVISLSAPEAVDIRLNGQKAVLADPRTKKVSNLEITLGNFKWFVVSDSTVSLLNDSSPLKRNDSSAVTSQAGTRQTPKTTSGGTL